MIRWPTFVGLVFISTFCFGKACQILSFYIESKVVSEGSVLSSFEADLNGCAARCKKHEFCNAANFVLSVDAKPYCSLVDTTRNGSDNETPISNSAVYSLTSFCFDKPSSCSTRQWSFERVPGYDLVDDRLVLDMIANSSLTHCLNSCAQIRDCEAAVFAPRTLTCRLSRFKFNNVNSVRQYFKHSNDVDLYENNCPKQHFDKRGCNFVRINQAGFVDVFDVRLDNIRNFEECETECLNWALGSCRSYTFDHKLRHCYLSHTTQKALSRSVLDSLSGDLSSGELDDCINFDLDCHSQSLTLTANSLNLLKGTIKAKKGRDFLCEQPVSENYTFSHQFSFDKCGIERKGKDDSTFSGVLMFKKEGSPDLITIHDKLIEVKCRVHDQIRSQQENQLSFHFDVEEQNVTISLDEKTTPRPAQQMETRAKYRLEVLNADGQSVDVVDVGQSGYLLITVDADDSNDADGFLISDLIAEDSVNFMQLIDSNGCVTADRSAVKSFERVSPKVLKVEIEFSGFADQAQVTYQALIKPCRGDNCNLECNAPFYVNNQTVPQTDDRARFRRISRRDTKSTSRHFALSEDVYQIRTSRLRFDESEPSLAHLPEDNRLESKLLTIKTTTQSSANSWSNAKDPLRRGERVGGNILQCFTEDISCLFTMILACLQIVLMISCSCIVYSYAKKWIRFYRNRNAANRRPSSFDEHHDFGADPASFIDSQTSTSLNSTRLTSATAAQPLKK